MRQKAMQQIIPSYFIHKDKLEDFLSTKNEAGSFKVTRKLDKYYIQYLVSNGQTPQELSWASLCHTYR
ncbi:hypothetical protein A1O3_00355, partial [Capronia epimyces CBS 606.96]